MTAGVEYVANFFHICLEITKYTHKLCWLLCSHLFHSILVGDILVTQVVYSLITKA